jgi:hypothetical protein
MWDRTRSKSGLAWNGIRFTGMPAFGDVETPDHVADVRAGIYESQQWSPRAR